jgi:Uma2 family endonuclease
MNVPNLKRMTAEDYAQWATRQDTGRFELIDGIVVQMNAERADHAQVKLNVAIALRQLLKASSIAGQVFGDGMAVRIADRVVHEPDAMLRLGPRLPGDTILVTDPVIVVEVLSPSTGPVDTGRKLTNYFMLDTVQHYLVVDTAKRLVLHYVRGEDGQPIMRAPISAGDVVLDPPGSSISIAEIFE